MKAPSPSFEHLARLTIGPGMLEHASGTSPLLEHGCCTDDNARLLVVACREPSPSPLVRELARKAQRFVADAQGVDGRIRNRRSAKGRWQDRPAVEDCWGRALWGLGTAAARDVSESTRMDALARFELSSRQRSPWVHAMSFAGLGAAEVLLAYPSHRPARDLLVDVAAVAGAPDVDAAWPWPEARLRYASAAIAEVLIAAGAVLERDDLLRRGLDRLAWLLEEETVDGRLSMTPVGGRTAGDERPAFDQQPIEVAAMADACARAAIVTGAERWTRGVCAAVDWFLGDNDVEVAMYDSASGGGYDGLTPHGPNTNEGAESTLALVSTLQHARNLVPVVG